MSKLQVGNKSKQIDKITFKHSQKEPKIINFLKESNTIESNDDDVSDEGTTTNNNNEEDSVYSKSTNTKVDGVAKIKNSTFNKIKRTIVTEKEEESVIKNPNKYINTKIKEKNYIIQI